MSKTTLDLRQNTILEILIDSGVNDVISWNDINQLDTGYTLTLDAGLTSEQIYTVGSGLTLVSSTNSITWQLDTSILETKKYTGVLVSDSKVAGIYFKSSVILTIS